jgi:hypothetical protein
MSSSTASHALATTVLLEESTFEDFLPPQNPFLADSPWPIFHQSTYAQASTILRGPEPGYSYEVDVLQTNAGGPSPWLVLSESYPDGTRVIWGATSTHVFKVLADEDSFEVIDSFRIDSNRFSVHWNLMVLEDNTVIVADRGKNQYYKFADADPTDWSSEIVLEDIFEVPESIPGNAGHFSLSYDGWIIFVTDAGYIGAVKNDFSEYRSLKLPQAEGETNFHNTYALDETGAIFTASTDRMIRVDWRDTEFSLAWDIPYDFRGPGCENINRNPVQEFLAVARGDTCTGSGTTPTLMGIEGQDKLVLVVDGHAPNNNMVAFWRDEIPDDWEGLPGYDRRVAAVTPLPYSTPEGEGFTAENSPTAWGYDVAVAQYNGFDPGPNPLPGVQKLTWDPNFRTLDVTWATDEVNFNNVLTYSAGTNLVYGTGQKDGIFYFWGLDWNTGDIALEVLLGEGDDYLNQGNQVIIDEQGNAYFSSVTGIVRLQPESLSTLDESTESWLVAEGSDMLINSSVLSTSSSENAVAADLTVDAVLETELLQTEEVMPSVSYVFEPEPMANTFNHNQAEMVQLLGSSEAFIIGDGSSGFTVEAGYQDTLCSCQGG